MKKVLIIDDKEEYRKLMVNLVKEIKSDAVIYETSDENEAYVIAIKRTIDLFIVDIILHSDRIGGDDSGAEFVHNIRSIERYRFTPVIIVSRLYDPKMHMYVTANCYKFLEKPFDKKIFKQTVESAIKYTTTEDNVKYIYFHNNGILEAVKANDILYMESSIKVLNVCTKKENFRIPRKTCSRMLNELDSDNFIMCNRRTIVNINHIKSIDRVNRYIIMNGISEVLDIGESMVKRFFEELERTGKFL